MAQSITRHHIEAVQEDEATRLTRYRAAWEAYEADYPKPLAIRPRPGRTSVDDNVLLGWASEVVDTSVTWLFKDDLTFDVYDPANPDAIDSPEVAEAQRWLAEVWAHNSKMTTLQKLGINGAVCGHAYLRIRPIETAEQAAFRATPELIRLQALDPANVTVTWDQDDIGRAVRYDVEWIALDPSGEPFVRRTRVELLDSNWWMFDERSTMEGDWYPIAEPVQWPFPWSPVADCQNLVAPNVYYGNPDLDPLLVQLVKAAIARASDLARTHRLHAHPQPYAKGMTPQQAAMISLGIDQLAALPNPEAELAFLEIGSDASTSLEFLRWLKEQVREHARIPEVAGGKIDNAGSLSGVALNILFQPLLSKTEQKRRTYGELIDATNRHLLQLAGWDSYRARIQWPELLPSDPKAEAETALLKEQLGVSTETLVGEMGYDAATEQARRGLDAEAAVRGLLSGDQP